MSCGKTDPLLLFMAHLPSVGMPQPNFWNSEFKRYACFLSTLISPV